MAVLDTDYIVPAYYYVGPKMMHVSDYNYMSLFRMITESEGSKARIGATYERNFGSSTSNNYKRMDDELKLTGFEDEIKCYAIGIGLNV
jgi:hypothetical protein